MRILYLWIFSLQKWWNHSCRFSLNLLVLRPEHSGQIQWLMMPWLLASPGHQQPLYWLCKIGKSLSSTGKGFSTSCTVSALRNDKNANIFFHAFREKNQRLGLISKSRHACLVLLRHPRSQWKASWSIYIIGISLHSISSYQTFF